MTVSAEHTHHLRHITLTERQRLDVEQILSGGFAPLSGFFDEATYHSVVSSMRIPSGSLWPMPIVLDIPRVDIVSVGEKIVLSDLCNVPIAHMTITSIYVPDKAREARSVYGTVSEGHPGVRYLMQKTGSVYIGGPVERIEHVPQIDFEELRYTPTELKEEFARRGWRKIVAFQTRNPMHRAHFEVLKRAAKLTDAKILLHPVAGLTQENDIDYPRRTRGYMRVCEKYLKDDAVLALLPIAMRMAGPREALWHALIRRNYGATHFIIGRDHAAPGIDPSGKPFYGPYAAQELARTHAHELGIHIVPIPEMLFVREENAYIPADEVRPHHTPMRISGTRFRKMLREGEEIPDWFSFPEVIEELTYETEMYTIPISSEHLVS